jgi:AraC family transcriptional regulator
MTADPQRRILSEPKILNVSGRTLVGINRRYTCETRSGIPGQWATFGQYIGKIPGQLSEMTYGVSHEGTPEGQFDYMCAVEVEETGALPTRSLPADFSVLRLESQQVAVFRHQGLVHEITATIDAIFFQWIPQSGYSMGGWVNVIEQYSEDFDPQTNAGWVDIWVPIHR